MIIIDSQEELAQLLEKVHLPDVGKVNLSESSVEFAHLSQGEIAFVHAKLYKSHNRSLQTKIQNLNCVILYDPLRSVKEIYPNTIFVVNAETNLEILVNLINILENMLRDKEILKSQLISINSELSDIMGNVEVEMMRVKKSYELRSPRRFQDFKGVQVLSKYCAGENVGGEFFDVFVEKNKIFVLMSATTSYLASSSILQLFSQFKIKKEISASSELKLISEIKEEVTKLNATKKKPIELALFTGIIDLKKHEMEGHIFGKFKMLSSCAHDMNLPTADITDGDFKSATYTRTFKREERILLCSPGFSKNCEQLNPEFMIEEVMTNKKIKSMDILDEIFFQLKKDTNTGYLANDASAIILEVQKNAMVEV